MTCIRPVMIGIITMALLAGAASAATLIGKKEFIQQSLPKGAKITKVTVTLNAENRRTLKEKWSMETADSSLAFIVSRNESGMRTGGVFFTTVYATEHKCVHGVGVALDSAGVVKDVVITEMYCERAMPMATRSFLGQFAKKAVKKAMVLDRDINGVTGATESCKEVIAAVNIALAAFNEFVK